MLESIGLPATERFGQDPTLRHRIGPQLYLRLDQDRDSEGRFLALGLSERALKVEDGFESICKTSAR